MSEDCVLQGSKFGMALSWDHSQTVADLDLQAVAFNNTGKLLDAVYYNNLKALRGLTHSGDETTGAKKGFDECIWVYPQKLPDDVKLVLFVVACYKGGCIRDAKNAKFHVLEDVLSHEVGTFGLEKAVDKAALVGSLTRTPSGAWSFRALDIPARHGQHFIDILEPTIGDYVRTLIPGAPRKIKAAFAMDKGSVVDLPESNKVVETCAGLGWDTTKGEVDLDVSAIMLDNHGSEVDCCFFGNQEAQGIKHSGDNLTGEGAGDDEVITLNLEALAAEVKQIFFVINIYTPGRTFYDVANPYCRLFSAQGEEFCRYQLREAGHEQALIMARMFREPGDSRWGFQALGIPCKGKTYKDSMPSVVQYCMTKPTDRSLMRQTTTMSDFDGPGSHPVTGRPLVESASKESTCGASCSMQ